MGEKEKKELKKKSKNSSSANIKSPSIRVENILSRITIKSAGDREHSLNVAKSILDEILLNLTEDADVQKQSSKSENKVENKVTETQPVAKQNSPPRTADNSERFKVEHSLNDAEASESSGTAGVEETKQDA